MAIHSFSMESLSGMLNEGPIELDHKDGLPHAGPSQHQCANGEYGPSIKYLVRLVDPIGVPLNDNTIDEPVHAYLGIFFCLLLL